MQNSIAVVQRTLPRQRVAIQEKNCTPEGTAMSRLTAEKNAIASAGKPVVNMWWTHTPKLMKAMAASDVATHT